MPCEERYAYVLSIEGRKRNVVDKIKWNSFVETSQKYVLKGFGKHQ